MTSLINIAVTAYNNGEHIRECLNSIVLQRETCEDFEVTIGYDVSSEDDTLDICKEFENNYNYIKILYMDKCFVGKARNNLARAGKSKYIYFVDGDDSLPQWSIHTLIGVVVDKDYDCVLGNMARIFPSGKKKITPPFTEKPTICRAFIHPVLYNIKSYNKLKCMENIRTHEDRICGYMIPKIYSYKTIPEVIYNYHVRKSSATRNTNRTIMIDDLVNVMEEMKNYMGYFSNDELRAIEDDLTWSAITTLIFAYDIEDVGSRYSRVIYINELLTEYFPRWTINKKLLGLRKYPLLRHFVNLMINREEENLAVFFDSLRMKIIKRMIEYKMYGI